MSHVIQFNVFLDDKHQSTQNLFTSKMNELPDSIPYLKKGDSNSYLQQFLSKPEQEPQVENQPNKPEAKDASFSCQKDEEYVAGQNTIFSPSSFHNFQKHLTVSLRNSIQIFHREKTNESQQVAFKLWKIFKNSNISTKKILHYILCQRNQHKITPQGLKQHGLQKIYDSYDQNLLKQARIYLAKETLKQIRQGKLQEYITNKKLKDKERFRKYVQIFVKELENGFLRKRLPKECVAFLQSQ